MLKWFLVWADLILFMHCVLFADSAFALNKNELREINNRVNALVILLSDNSADEYQEAREIAELDLDNDGHKLITALFSIEGFNGGNGHVQYLAVFVDRYEGISTRPTRLTLLDFTPVGSKGWRSLCCFSSIRLVQNEVEINFDTKEYGTDDPSCCPSVASHAVYRMKIDEITGRLREITAQLSDAPHGASECCR
ncbi:hypothetical protein [Candidatus Electronema sp. TJ]|uniref:hypothetical protein n=1 Tax=Candidatus Electronema sp. TJ TaxID=3401573 RepID=UPI003AA95390